MSWATWWPAATDAGGVVGIYAIGGMAGVGKTTLAVRAAHRLADRFPAGQIVLSLHGHTPGQHPVDPADALASLLVTAGVPAGQIPPGLEARMALWRDRLAERRLLLVLDDAASSEQVIPLLPGTGGSLVLVTSRRHLSALEDAIAISLDTLPPAEAAAWPARSAAPGMRLTRWLVWAGARWPPATPSRQKTCSGRRWRSSSGSGRPSLARFPQNFKRLPMRRRTRADDDSGQGLGQSERPFEESALSDERQRARRPRREPFVLWLGRHPAFPEADCPESGLASSS